MKDFDELIKDLQDAAGSILDGENKSIPKVDTFVINSTPENSFTKLISDRIKELEKGVDTKHYDKFNYDLTKDELDNGCARIDPYFVALIWKLGQKDPSGCLFHMLKTIARFSDKEGNSVTREIKSLEATIKRMKELYQVD